MMNLPGRFRGAAWNPRDRADLRGNRRRFSRREPRPLARDGNTGHERARLPQWRTRSDQAASVAMGTKRERVGVGARLRGQTKSAATDLGGKVSVAARLQIKHLACQRRLLSFQGVEASPVACMKYRPDSAFNPAWQTADGRVGSRVMHLLWTESWRGACRR